MKDKVCHWIARTLIPSRLIYWCAVVLGVHATQGKHSTTIIPDLTFMDALKRWDER